MYKNIYKLLSFYSITAKSRFVIFFLNKNIFMCLLLKAFLCVFCWKPFYVSFVEMVFFLNKKIWTHKKTQIKAQIKAQIKPARWNRALKASKMPTLKRPLIKTHKKRTQRVLKALLHRATLKRILKIYKMYKT